MARRVESAYEPTLEAWRQRGYYPLAIEGRDVGGGNEFRAQLAVSPPPPFGFTSAHGLNDAEYEAVQQADAANRLCQTSVQSFADRAGVERFQATWIWDPYRAHRCIRATFVASRAPDPEPPERSYVVPVPEPVVPPAPPPPPEAPVIVPVPRDDGRAPDADNEALNRASGDDVAQTVEAPDRGNFVQRACGGDRWRVAALGLVTCLGPSASDICSATTSMALKHVLHKVINARLSGLQQIGATVLVDEMIRVAARQVGEACSAWAQARLPPPPGPDLIGCMTAFPSWFRQQCTAGDSP